MSKCAIFYFSATGNTKFVAQSIKQAMEKRWVKTTLYDIDTLDKMPDISDVEYVGLGYPVHFFTIPPLMEKFAWSLPNALENQKAFVFATYGLTGVKAIEQGVIILDTKIYEIRRSRGFVMPDNFTPSPIMYWAKPREDVIKKCFQRAEEEADFFVAEILTGEVDVEAPFGFLGDVLSSVVGFLFKNYIANMWGRMFKVTEKCNSCGLCASTCPAGNIHMVDGEPIYSDHCVLCCRCINICPQKAIEHPLAPYKSFQYKAPNFIPPNVEGNRSNK